MAKSREEHLQEVLESYRMVHVQDEVDRHRSARDEVRKALESAFGAAVYAPMNSGSFAKHTAINSLFDLDIVVPFKRDSFGKLSDMYEAVLNELASEFGARVSVRGQKVSAGVTFIDENVSLDVVPGRELNQDQYIEDRNLNLFVSSNYGTLAESTFIQTNIHAQIEHIKAREDERKVIRLLKVWKANYGPHFKSFLLELATIKAFDQCNPEGSLWEKLRAVLEYLAGNLTEDSFHLHDPGNSNNDVISVLTASERAGLASALGTMGTNIDSDAKWIEHYFPFSALGPKKESFGRYGIKTGKDKGKSVPPNNQRFG